MPVFLFKSLLSLLVIGGAMIAMFTMFEIFGRSPQRFDAEKLKVIHRINGRIYFLLFLLLTYICIDFIIATKGELSSRATFHSVFSLAVLVLFLLKISFVKIYRQFYGQVQVLGILVVLFTFGMVGTSGIYYLMVTEFGTHSAPRVVAEPGSKDSIADQGTDDEKYTVEIKEDDESIGRGKKLFEERCSYCHETKSTRSRWVNGFSNPDVE